MHLRGESVTGLSLFGGIATYLRKKGTADAARARELLSRGATVKERDDAIAVVVPDDSFLLMSELSVVDMLNEALASLGVKKRVRVEKTDEDMRADDISRARELFGKDCVVIDRGQ